MTITFTARHFKARPELQKYAEDAVRGLSQLYEGIVSADVVLEAQQHGDGKIAEIGLIVAREKLFAKEQTNDFVASVTACADKLERQLGKYKAKVQNGRQPKDRLEIVDDGSQEEIE